MRGEHGQSAAIGSIGKETYQSPRLLEPCRLLGPSETSLLVLAALAGTSALPLTMPNIRPNPMFLPPMFLPHIFLPPIFLPTMFLPKIFLPPAFTNNYVPAPRSFCPDQTGHVSHATAAPWCNIDNI